MTKSKSVRHERKQRNDNLPLFFIRVYSRSFADGPLLT